MNIIDFFNLNPHTFLIVTAVVSLFVGSFLNVVIYRLPIIMHQSWSEECRIYLGFKDQPAQDRLNLCLPFSHCPHCKKVILPWHNIPVVSYIFLWGKCAYCKSNISARYPFIEILTCLMSVYVAWKFGITWQTLGALIFTWISICLTFIDLDHHLLPDELTLSLVWVGLFLSIFSIFTPSHDAIIGGILGYGIFAAIQLLFGYLTGKTGMGQGDYKYLAGMGTLLGWQALPLIILLASIMGVIITFTHMLIRRNFKSEHLPFGPYLALAGWIAMLWGREITHYYLLWI